MRAKAGLAASDLLKQPKKKVFIATKFLVNDSYCQSLSIGFANISLLKELRTFQNIVLKKAPKSTNFPVKRNMITFLGKLLSKVKEKPTDEKTLLHCDACR